MRPQVRVELQVDVRGGQTLRSVTKQRVGARGAKVGFCNAICINMACFISISNSYAPSRGQKTVLKKNCKTRNSKAYATCGAYITTCLSGDQHLLFHQRLPVTSVEVGRSASRRPIESAWIVEALTLQVARVSEYIRTETQHVYC